MPELGCTRMGLPAYGPRAYHYKSKLGVVRGAYRGSDYGARAFIASRCPRETSHFRRFPSSEILSVRGTKRGYSQLALARSTHALPPSAPNFYTCDTVHKYIFISNSRTQTPSGSIIALISPTIVPGSRPCNGGGDQLRYDVHSVSCLPAPQTRQRCDRGVMRAIYFCLFHE